MPLTTSVTSSSAVGAKATSRWARSLSLNMFGPIVSQRPVVCHSSAGCMMGNTVSCAPARSISSRTICWIFFNTRIPRGKYAYSPPATFRTSDALTSSLCDSISASCGLSRNVWINALDHFMSSYLLRY